MKVYPLPILLAMALIATGEPLLKLDKLALKSGKEFSGVSVTEKRPDGISIMHADGTARIRFEDLPDDVAGKLGITANSAAQHREATAEAQKSAKAAAALAASKIDIKGRVFQVANDGVLLESAHYSDGTKVEKKIPYKVETGGWNALHPEAPKKRETRFKSTWVETVKSFNGLVFVRCDVNGFADGDVFSGPVFPDGTYGYENLQGAKKTVPAFAVGTKKP